MISPLKKPYYSLLLAISLVIVPSTLTLAQSSPPVSQGLPPSPPTPSEDDLPPLIDYDSPLPQLPDNFTNQSPKEPQTNPQPSPTPINSEPIIIPVTPSPVNNNSAPTGNQLYRVEILGDSPLMLAQVQQFEPQAFIRSGEGVIQAGLFGNEENAQGLLRQLQAQGLQGQVIAVNSATVNTSPKVAVSSVNRPSRALGYFVIIPASKNDLPEIFNQVTQSGIEKNLITQQTYPRGSHIGIGPFSSRGDAERWNGYFRSLGRDARIYFGR